jgi:hypothetical protein
LSSQALFLQPAPASHPSLACQVTNHPRTARHPESYAQCNNSICCPPSVEGRAVSGLS